jgi:hypothetical protein
LLTNFTLGQTSYEIRGPFRGLDPVQAVRRRTIRSRDFPLVVEAASGGEWDFAAAFDSGLDIIIDGLAARSKKSRASGAKIASHDVLVAAREYDHVARLDVDRRELTQGHPTTALSAHVERGHRSFRRLEPGRHQPRRGRRKCPRLCELAEKMYRARKAHDAQNFRQDVHERPPHVAKQHRRSGPRKPFRTASRRQAP